MKIKRILGAALAVTCFVTATAVPTVQGYAESFATPNALISDMLDRATTGINSASLPTALAAAKALITTDGDKVLYDGVEIGYWYSGDSTSLYADDTQSAVLIEKSGEDYTVDPDLLKTILTDVNEEISEVYEPTTGDWSKIIGKYDITLGDVTIPAEQWLTLEASDDPLTLTNAIDISSITGLQGESYSYLGHGNKESLSFFAWLVDQSGNLYIQNGMSLADNFNSKWWFGVDTITKEITSKVKQFTALPGASSSSSSSSIQQPKLKLQLIKSTDPDYKGYLHTELFATDLTNEKVAVDWSTAPLTTAENLEPEKLHSIENPAIICEDISTAKIYGVTYVYNISQLGLTSQSNAAYHAKHLTMFNSNSASKTVIGNATLTKRLSKVANLNPTDTITLTASNWLVNNTTDIDTYIATQEMLNAGDTADINAVAELEPLCFNVVVPTTLPIYVAADGTVTTATNATVENKSNAAVKITGISTVAKPESGWTLVAENPSDTRDANEFTFRTSLAVDDVLARAEVKPFTYNVELSPMTAGTDNLDLATVSVTVDWADA